MNVYLYFCLGCAIVSVVLIFGAFAQWLIDKHVYKGKH